MRLQKWFMGLAAVFFILAILYLGREFFVPLAIALLLFSLMGAAIDRVSALRVGRIRISYGAATAIVTLLIAAALGGILWIVYVQIEAIRAQGPAYVEKTQAMLTDMLTALFGDSAAGMLDSMDNFDITAYLPTLAGSAGYVLATLLVVGLYVGFLLAERQTLPRKLARLYRGNQQQDPTGARRFANIYQSITRNVHRYVFLKVVLSIIEGILLYIVMKLFRLDFAETLALLAILLNFIPNIGSILSTIAPLLVAVAQFDSWTTVLALFLTIAVLQFAAGNIIEPLFMGHRLHLSPFVIVLSLTFWGFLWGPVGLFLAVPIMVIVLIICSHVPALRPVAVLLSHNGKLVEGAPQDR